MSNRGEGEKKWARYLCQDNTGEHVHPCEREPKSALEGVAHAPLSPPLGSSRCRQVTGWCCSNVFRSERSRSICDAGYVRSCTRQNDLTTVTLLSTADFSNMNTVRDVRSQERQVAVGDEDTLFRIYLYLKEVYVTCA